MAALLSLLEALSFVNSEDGNGAGLLVIKSSNKHTCAFGQQTGFGMGK